MRFRFLPLLAICMIAAALFVMSSEAHSTGEDTEWSRTTTQEATASFSSKHAPELYTEGTVSVSHSIRSSSTVGAQVLDTVQASGKLVRCESNSCTTIWSWSFSGERDISGTNLLQVNADSLTLSGDLEITVQVNGEPTNFTVRVPLTATWTTTADQNACGETAGNAIGASTLQPASFTGNLAGYKLSQVDARIIESDIVYGKSPVGSCA